MRHFVDVCFEDDDEVTLRVLAWVSGRSEADVLRRLLRETVRRAGEDDFVRDATGRVAFLRVPVGRRVSTGNDGTVG